MEIEVVASVLKSLYNCCGCVNAAVCASKFNVSWSIDRYILCLNFCQLTHLPKTKIKSTRKFQIECCLATRSNTQIRMNEKKTKSLHENRFVLTSVVSICGFSRAPFFSLLINHFFRWRLATNAHATTSNKQEKKIIMLKLVHFFKLNVQTNEDCRTHNRNTAWTTEQTNERTKKKVDENEKSEWDEEDGNDFWTFIWNCTKWTQSRFPSGVRDECEKFCSLFLPIFVAVLN